MFAFAIHSKESNKSLIKNYIFPRNKIKIIEYNHKPYVGITIENLEVEKAEQIFKNYIEILDPKIVSKLNSYKRQYVGISSQGKRIIYINLVKSPTHWSKQQWEKELFFHFDGGINYISVKVNIDDNFCYDLFINGEA